ncbi:MAG: adenylyltransferase/cytidyltransferase family protein [Candidatus Hodarchaeota archaeon]
MSSELNSTEVYQVLLKKFLKTAYVLTMKNGSFDLETFSNEITRTHEESTALLSVLKSLQMIKSISNPAGHFRITTGGKNNLKLILVGGVFDIIHLGHLETLKEAKKLGDLLLVVVASDQTVKSSKGRAPLNSQANRAKLLSHIDIVDIVHQGDPDPSKFLNVVVQYQVDVIALGYDQADMEEKMHQLLIERGLKNVEIIKLKTSIPNEKSSLKLKNLDEKSFD